MTIIFTFKSENFIISFCLVPYRQCEGGCQVRGIQKDLWHIDERRLVINLELVACSAEGIVNNGTTVVDFVSERNDYCDSVARV